MFALECSLFQCGPFSVLLKGRNHADKPDGNTAFVNERCSA